MSYGNYAPFYRTGFFNPMQQPLMQEPQNQWQLQNMQQPLNPQIQTPTNDMIWVLNENEATSYPVAPNNSVVLWDKSKNTIYVKSMNAQGVPSMRILDFVDRNSDSSNSHENASKKHECSCGDKFATKEQINDLRGKIDDLTTKYEELTRSVPEKTKTNKKKEIEE